MNFHEFGAAAAPHIMLIHGGGNAWWNYLRQARALAERYHVILPTLDGHGEEYAADYQSTQASADKLMAYIEERCGGRLFALGGVSLGGQIVLELLSRKPELAEKAIVDGSVCYPRPAMARFCLAAVGLCWGLMFSERACRFQLAAMPKILPEKMLYPEELREHYLRDMPRLRKETLFAIYRTYMADYTLKESIRETKAQITYWYGEKEMRCVKKSAQMVKRCVPSCEIYEAKGYNHGYLSIYLPDEWLALAEAFFQR
ncbi:alpha/beta fold hydrolase [Pseudoflavonifractor sp. BIOML-A6]|nr:MULTISPECIES: alpha/beta hydrolase [unclassified Pseudoflavonifractor]MTQ95671.1 alpha/beta fold hydrolase [Pseudoflavonifractor sp. BIOML-A16]MTR05648.1 alpha/beta fold hydrolase [Pseudoflavonifractor sp. BIOML-A15]MTR32071.1 alpha/beta fold hydrolase [Pseudoflavonifractor sp. BIOML-A14]MTR73095.1 alpha/beta fold hydrolase [Pseudoflavonifractor sp. BIOML-A18]MTS65196.1 alpha/beta fold hydrolase [Pseudoflavonifractor sp. BIOML-A5]MTS71300.1 alpha/beta fold hydrolase [Pseudoflavonifractor s